MSTITTTNTSPPLQLPPPLPITTTTTPPYNYHHSHAITDTIIATIAVADNATDTITTTSRLLPPLLTQYVATGTAMATTARAIHITTMANITITMDMLAITARLLLL